MREIISSTPEITKRYVNPGAEKWLGKPIEVLDHGFVYLVDYMGGDAAIDQSARVSYGGGTRKVSQSEGLLRYSMRNEHTSPCEMVEFKFHAKMPIFVARQWVRHRTASINEISGRYSILENEFYIPEKNTISVQSADNKQGRGLVVQEQYADEVRSKLNDTYGNSRELYEWLLNDKEEDKPGLARELARIPLPVATYTEWYWKIDLHNLLHFLKLRMDPHAQWEIRQYANAIAEIVKDSVPLTWKAFEDYQLNAVKLSVPEQETLVSLLSKKKFTKDEIISAANASGITDGVEIKELLLKFAAMRMLNK